MSSLSDEFVNHRRAEDGALCVNFDDVLVSILRETRYFKLMASELPMPIPPLALKARLVIARPSSEVWICAEDLQCRCPSAPITFRDRSGAWNYSQQPTMMSSAACSLWRRLCCTLRWKLSMKLWKGASWCLASPADHYCPAAVNNLTCEQVLNWNSHQIEDNVEATLAAARAASETLAALKGNLEQVRAILAGWAAAPIFQRKDLTKVIVHHTIWILADSMEDP